MEKDNIILSEKSILEIINNRSYSCLRLTQDIDSLASENKWEQTSKDGKNYQVYLQNKKSPSKIQCPYGPVGKFLHVQETWADVTNLVEWKTKNKKPPNDDCKVIAHQADGQVRECTIALWPPKNFITNDMKKKDLIKWNSPLDMPLYYSRFYLILTNVSLLKLQKSFSLYSYFDEIITEPIENSVRLPDDKWAWSLTFKVVKPSYCWITDEEFFKKNNEN